MTVAILNSRTSFIAKLARDLDSLDVFRGMQLAKLLWQEIPIRESRRPLRVAVVGETEAGPSVRGPTGVMLREGKESAMESEISEVERLANEFEAHEGQEGEFLKRYKDLAGKTDNRLVKLLLQMIIADEERHHAITHAMASTLKADLAWTNPGDAIRGLYDLKPEKDRLAELTDEFIRVEKDGIGEYKRLIKSSRGFYRDLFALLFRSMIRDSEKHVEILEFLREKLREP